MRVQDTDTERLPLSHKDYSIKELIQAQACINHSATGELGHIRVPTLCIGGADDHIVGTGQSEALAADIPQAELQTYPGLGHGAFGETKAFNLRMLEFLLHG